MQWLHDAWSLWCRGDVSQSVTFARTYPEISSKSLERLIGRQRSRRSLLRRFLAATHPPQEYTVNRINWSGFQFGFERSKVKVAWLESAPVHVYAYSVTMLYWDSLDGATICCWSHFRILIRRWNYLPNYIIFLCVLVSPRFIEIY